MYKVKITVLETKFFKDLADEYAVDGYGLCELHKPGQVFYSNGWQKPTGLCDNAWRCMFDYVLAIAQHAGHIYGDGSWFRKENFAIVTCNDGVRPVVFKLEGTDEPADVFNDDLEKVDRFIGRTDTSTK